MAMAPKHVVDIYVINIPQISCVRQLIKPNIVYKDTTGMTNHMIEFGCFAPQRVPAFKKRKGVREWNRNLRMVEHFSTRISQ